MPLIRKGASETAAGAFDPDRAAVLLREGSDEERWAAARGLAVTPGAARLLGAALASEPDERVREAIFTSLARIGGADSLDAVLPHLRSDDANLRTGALDALRLLCATDTSRLETLLRDPDVDVRILACELVRETAPAEAARWLSVVVETDPEVNVCAAAVDVLAEAGSAEALPALARCVARFPDQPFLAFAVRVACERIGAAPDRNHG